MPFQLASTQGGISGHMAMRLIRLPEDLIPLTSLLAESFHYPENEDWSVQTDEIEQMTEAMVNFKRLWPLIRTIQMFSPPLRDIYRGFVWEEDDQLIGTVVGSRRGTTDTWIIGNVGVLPEYRRRGIAKKLVNEILYLIRERGGKRAILGVISENLPAYTLYEKLGFEDYGGNLDFHAFPEEAPPSSALPGGYVQLPQKRFDWQPRYELEKRICPESTEKYEPVEEGRFRAPILMRLLWPLVSYAQGMRDSRFIIRSEREDQVVARARMLTPTRGVGVVNLDAHLDPAHGEIAAYLVGHMLQTVVRLSPGFRVEISVPDWMKALVVAVEDAGFERRYEHRMMGIEI